MAKIFHLKSTSTPALLKCRIALSARLRVPLAYVRASYVKQFLTCGKKNCRCHRGAKHGPFHYLVQCMGVGNVRKFLLKTTAQREAALAGIAAHDAIQACLEELSQINTELLRRGALFGDAPHRIG
ncbi:MAG: DUF6788 family protein [Limisphaerales bacterium]